MSKIPSALATGFQQPNSSIEKRFPIDLQRRELLKQEALHLVPRLLVEVQLLLHLLLLELELGLDLLDLRWAEVGESKLGGCVMKGEILMIKIGTLGSLEGLSIGNELKVGILRRRGSIERGIRPIRGDLRRNRRRRRGRRRRR